MDDNRKPRHIRDIAHLYLSRMPTRSHRNRVWVMSASRDCFGGYHAANLALGIARKGHAVDLVEVSGLLPCAAYFLRLPPRVYLKHKAEFPQEPLSALAGIKVRFSIEPRETPRDMDASASQPLSQSYRSSRDASQPLSQSYRSSRDASQPLSQPRGSRNRVELIHLPPASDIESLQPHLTRARKTAGDDRVHVLVLAADDSKAQDIGHRLLDTVPGIQWSTLSLERTVSSGDRKEADGHSLGYLVGWRQLLSDPVPCVVRDPESHVSISYLSICNVLVSAGNTTKARNDQIPRARSAFLGRSG